MIIDRDINNQTSEPDSRKQKRLKDMELDYYDPLAEIE